MKFIMFVADQEIEKKKHINQREAVKNKTVKVCIRKMFEIYDILLSIYHNIFEMINQVRESDIFAYNQSVSEEPKERKSSIKNIQVTVHNQIWISRAKKEKVRDHQSKV